MADHAGSLIHEARYRAGITQMELARRAKTSQSIISIYETGKREPSLSMLNKLIQATGCTLKIQISTNDDSEEGPALPDTELGNLIQRHRLEIIRRAEKRGIINVRVFSSVARGTDSENSDIDLLVDAAPHVSVLGLIGLELELESLLERPVEVVTASSLKTKVGETALVEAIPL